MKPYVNLSNHVPGYEPNKRILQIAQSLNGLTYAEWEGLKLVLDSLFKSKAAKVELDDSVDLVNRLAFEFANISSGDKLLLASILGEKNSC